MIYCVEDDQGIRDLMLYTLKASDFEARGFESGEELYEALETQKPELILLDVMLPGDDGITILRRLRSTEETKDVPVIIASAKGTEYDKVIGLDLGADDYLAKPFGMMEMISRVRAVLRRSRSSTPASAPAKILTNGRIEMNDTDHIVTASGDELSLTLKEYELLRVFLQAPGRVFTRDQLLQMVWGIEFAGESRTVDVHIGTLRNKLGDCSGYITTVRGVGYRMEKKA